MSLQNNQSNDSVLINQTLDPSKGRSKSVVDSPRAKKTRRGSSSVLKKDQNAGCSCSGDCGSKRCGCVKKDKSCSEFCRCTDLCKNQVDRASENDEDEDDEDKENVQTRKKETKKKTEKNPAPKERVTRHRQVKMLINEDSSSDGTPMRPSKPKSLFNTPESENPSSYSETSPEEKRTMNPMKPRHQLQRSPPNKSMDTLNISERLDLTVKYRSPSSNVSSTNTIVNETNTSLQVNSCKLEVSSPASNPMKPRHKLARSPIAGPSSDRDTRSKSKSPNLKKNTSSGYDDDDVFLSVSMADSSKPITSPTLPPGKQ
ncbi:hypothetical protein G9C98_004212 [Cotesia typhae]|uniref:Tesmin/TSO1-like CXC domain-containing protein n=1 Tax=Cotesia typhae TaxID=2053667 RepID=A0A8J5QNC7_9HYME|nr:hypothetical protein G9C98_004212 [Cotesia typhae]